MAKTVKGTLDELKGSISKDFNKFANALQAEIVRETPKRTGRAQRSWTKPERVVKDNYNVTITENRLEYIGPLDEGSSKQAPNGIVQPAIDKITRRYK